jgi:hypothetical protein
MLGSNTTPVALGRVIFSNYLYFLTVLSQFFVRERGEGSFTCHILYSNPLAGECMKLQLI